MKITLKNLKKEGFEIENLGDGDYDCWHNGTDIQISRDGDGIFWTDLFGVYVDIKNMESVKEMLNFAKKFIKRNKLSCQS